jgi:histidinol phosphatase-like PHP family hydrolase
MEYGVSVARRAWVPPEKVLNTWLPEDIRVWLASRGKTG